MKKYFFIGTAAAILSAAASCKSKKQKDAGVYMNKINKTMEENPVDVQQKTNTAPFAIPKGLESITGEWELVKIIADDNNNKKIDPEEESNAITTGRDYLNLHADGTCEYTIARLEGRYLIEKTDNGRTRLTMYDRTGTETTRGRYIISVSDKELIINRILGGSSFEIFTRP